MLIQKLARIDWGEKKFIAAGGEGNVYKVPIYFVQDGEEKTRWCVLKKAKDEFRHSLVKEEDFNYLLNQALVQPGTMIFMLLAVFYSF